MSADNRVVTIDDAENIRWHYHHPRIARLRVDADLEVPSADASLVVLGELKVAGVGVGRWANHPALWEVQMLSKCQAKKGRFKLLLLKLTSFSVDPRIDIAARGRELISQIFRQLEYVQRTVKRSKNQHDVGGVHSTSGRHGVETQRKLTWCENDGFVGVGMQSQDLKGGVGGNSYTQIT